MNTELIVASLVVLAAFFQALPKVLDIFKADISLSDNKQRDGSIIDLLHRFRHEYAIRRITIDAFHNGGHYYSGEGIAKVTRRFESHKHEIEGTIHKYQAVTTSVLADNPAHVERSGLIIDTNVGNPSPIKIQEKKYLRVFQESGCYFLISWGIYQNIFIPRKMKKCKVLVGIMHIEFDEGNMYLDCMRMDRAELASFCKKVTEINKLAFPKLKFEEQKYSLMRVQLEQAFEKK